MKRTRLLFLVLATLLLTSGCSGKIYKEFSLDKSPTPSLSLDARQRVILVTDHGGPDGNRRVVCAEPSPDVFATAAVGAALNAKLGKEDVGAALSSAEMAGALGLRTQTIQLLRDGLYRTCEAYLNGVIQEDAYQRIIAAYDEVLITLIAVEGLTQQVPPILPTTGAGASATPGGEPGAVSSDATPAAVTTADSNLPGAEVATQVHGIVRDYYCFQVGIKEFFYSSLDPVDKTVRKHLCGQGKLRP